MPGVRRRRREGGVRAGRIRRAGRSIAQGLGRALGGGGVREERLRDIFRRRG